MRQALLPLVLAIVLSGCAAAPPAAIQGLPGSFAPALAQAFPLTVGVYATGDRDRVLLGQPHEEDGSVPVRVGSGFMIDTQGTVATVAHLLETATSIAVRLADGRVVAAEVIGEDPSTDVALLRVPAGLRSAPVFGRSAALRAGDWVLAIGEPFGFNRSVAAGIVGGKDRHFIDDREMMSIQSDIAFNPGNSGGPLLDTSGAIVGMNQRTIVGPFGTPGVSMSAPIELVLQIAAELRQGTVVRPRMGALFHDLMVPQALKVGSSHAHGAVVTGVERGSLGNRIGLRPDDIIVAMNGRSITGAAELARALLAWRKADGTRLVVLRERQYLELVLP